MYIDAPDPLPHLLLQAILPADYAPYPDRPTDRSTGPLDPINPVPEAHAGVLTDLIIQCYAACRALFSRSPGVFGNRCSCQQSVVAFPAFERARNHAIAIGWM